MAFTAVQNMPRFLSMPPPPQFADEQPLAAWVASTTAHQNKHDIPPRSTVTTVTWQLNFYTAHNLDDHQRVVSEGKARLMFFI